MVDEDETSRAPDGIPAVRARAWLAPVLLGLHLVAAGLLNFNLRTSDLSNVLLQWSLGLLSGIWAYQIVRRYLRGPWRTRHPGFDRIFLASLGAALVGALVPFTLHWTLPCEWYELERYVRGLVLTSTVYLFANASGIFVLMALPYLLSGRRRTSIAFGLVITALLHAIHVTKYVVLQQHLYTWDHMLIPDVLEILPLLFGSGGVVMAAVATGLFILALAVAGWRERPSERIAQRAGILGAGLLATALVITLTIVGAGKDADDPSEYFPLWNRHSYNSYHNKTGLSFTLLRGIRHLRLNQAPADYSPAAMARIAKAHPRTKNHIVPTADVIFYMVESLSDLSAYGLAYKQDPLPHFHALQADQTSGRLVVPIYGGNTPNTEFEVLTGLSRVRPWPHDLSYAYRQWITRKTPALPWVFQDWGYRTAVVSGAKHTIFGESEAYPKLGFEEFHALGDEPGLARKFDLISDHAVVDRVIDILRSTGAGQDAAPGGASRRPCFLAITTDSTHGPYGGARTAGDRRFELKSNDLPEEARTFALDYGTALNHADEALGRLVAFVKQRDKPTVLFVYGDHKPALGVLFDAGVFRSGWPGAVLDKYSTPLAIWSNVPQDETPKTQAMPLLLSANFLSIELFRRLGIKHPPSTFHYTQAVYAAFPVVSRVIGDRAGAFHDPAELTGAPALLIRDYGLIKYDVLIGREGK